MLAHVFVWLAQVSPLFVESWSSLERLKVAISSSRFPAARWPGSGEASVPSISGYEAREESRESVGTRLGRLSTRVGAEVRGRWRREGDRVRRRLEPHARSLGGVWLYLRGTSSAARRAAALAEIIEPEINASFVSSAPAEEAARERAGRWSSEMAAALALLLSAEEAQQRRELVERLRPLRVLCLDGGGMKGRNLLVMIRELERVAGAPVSELFDVVCGTSIGGCGALFVSRFGADATTHADAAFRGLQRRCFAPKSHRRLLQDGHYCDDRRAELVKELLGGIDVRLLDARATTAPLSFVVAARRSPDGDPEPFLFRTYPVAAGPLAPLPGTSNASLIDAVVATSAAPAYFAPADRKLVDGGCAFNNPALVALHELRAAFPHRPVGCLVSLGCGQAPPTGSHRLVYGDRPEETITHEYARALVGAVRGAVYERFDPPLPAYVSPAEHRDPVLDDMERHTRAWLQHPDTRRRFRRLARHLRPAPLPTPTLASCR